MSTFSQETHFDVDPNQIVVDARNFASWRNGLPEWMKNSSDAYERALTPADERVIVIFFARDSGNGKSALACLDFVGMTCGDLIGKLARYGDPQASGVGAHIVGGHGNGGKLFAVGGFKGGVVWRTMKNGLRSEYGLANPGRPEFAFVVDENGEISDRVCDDLAAPVEEWLRDLGLSTSNLPTVAQDALRKAGGVTLVLGSCPEFSNQLPEAHILGTLQSPPSEPNTARNGKAIRPSRRKTPQQG